MNTSAEFFSHVVKEENGCWTWTGTKDRLGYGRIWWARESGKHEQLAHRVSYFLAKGVFPTLSLDHLCRNPSCVSPSHLEEVPQRVNVLRGTSPSAVAARKTKCLRGHNFDKIRVGKRGRTFRGCSACAALHSRSARQRERAGL